MVTELKVVYPTAGSNRGQRVDIVFVHGLNPTGDPDHSEKTWTHESGTHWPRDLLPERIPHARILIFSYNSNVAWDVSEAGIRQHANTLLDLVQGEREETNSSSHPLVFIGHSLGGLIIKQALLLAKHNDRVYERLRQNTKSIVFFATPHRGGNGTTIGQIAVNVTLAQLSADFSHQYEDYNFLSVVETKGLIKAPFRTVIVDPSSSIIGLAGHREQILELDRDHRQICKFTQDADFNRVCRHLKRLADSALHDKVLAGPGGDASRETRRPDTLSSESMGVSTLSSTNLVKLSTLNFKNRGHFVGQAELLENLHSFLESRDDHCLLLTGPAGSGKSAVAYEFTYRCSDRFSVFWFSAESLESLQRDVNRASHTIAPNDYGNYLRNHIFVLKDWLANEGNGRWILVFDNANEEFNLPVVFPSEHTYGKIIITSRHNHVNTQQKLQIRSVPALSQTETLKMFLTTWEGLFYSKGEQNAAPTVLSTITNDLDGRPYAVALAAACVASLPLPAAEQQLGLLNSDETMPPGDCDPKIWKWFSLLIGELSPVERDVLHMFAVFDGSRITDEFVDILLAAAREQTAAGLYTFVASGRIRPSIERLVSVQLLHRYYDPWTQYLYIPLCVRDCLCHFLSQHQDYGPHAARIGASLLGSASVMSSINSFDRRNKRMGILAPHYRALSSVKKDLSIPLDSQLSKGVLPLVVYFLDESVADTIMMGNRQLWRTWLHSRHFSVPPLPMSCLDDEDSMHTMLGWPAAYDLASIEPVSPWIYKAIYDGTWNCLHTGILLAVAGSHPWANMREDLIEPIRQCGGDRYSASEVDDLLNKINTGVSRGIQSGGVKVLDDKGFKYDIMDVIGKETVEKMSRLIADVLSEGLFPIAQLSLDSAISEPMHSLAIEIFYLAVGCFDEILKGSIKSILWSILEPTVSSKCGIESIEDTVGFMVSNTAQSEIQEHAKTAARGFFEAVDGCGLLLAADILNRLNSAFLQHETSSTKETSKELDEFTCRVIELVREGTMMWENRPGFRWKSMTRKGMYWCIQAELCRTGWTMAESGAHSRYTNQERWEECCIFMDIKEGKWPLLI